MKKRNRNRVKGIKIISKKPLCVEMPSSALDLYCWHPRLKLVNDNTVVCRSCGMRFVHVSDETRTLMDNLGIRG